MHALRKQIWQNLDKAKRKHGTFPVRFLKIFCTGSGAAGKTSFIQLLLKKKFNDKHHSTNVVHANHAVSVRSAAFHGSSSQTGEVKWMEMDFDFEMKILNSILLPDNLQKPDSSLNAKSDAPITASVSSKQYVYKPPNAFLKKLVPDVLKSPVKRDKVTTVSHIVNSLTVAESLLPTVTHQLGGEVLNMMTILDTGGQPEYIHLLPTININPTVTFIVHDLSKSLDDQVLVEYSQHGEHVFVPYHLSYTNMDMIKLLMSAANDAAERPPSNIPFLATTPTSNNTSYICFVGTHADKVSKQTIDKADEKLSTLVSNTNCKTVVWHKDDGGVLYAIDNTTAGKDTEDPAASALRARIEEKAAEKDIYELPIMWMLLQLEIQQVCSQKQKSYITVKECVKLARDAGLISSQEEVKSVLLYYHLLRVLIYFEAVPGLCDYVIVDHQWWFDKLSNIISTAFQQSKLNFQAVQKLKYEGILSTELLQCIKWDDEIKEEFFLSLLIHMKIIATVVTGGNSDKQYFIPFVLPTYNSQQQSEILAQYGHLQGEPLLIRFQSGLIPRGLFCSLIVELLQNPPKGWHPHLSKKGTHHTFSNLISFSLPNAYSLSLFDKVSFLEVQLRHPEEAFQLPVHHPRYSQLKQAIVQTCGHLNFDHSRLQFGFLCNCGSITEDHIAIIPEVSQSTLFAECSNSTTFHLKLTASHIIWLSDQQTLPPTNGKYFKFFSIIISLLCMCISPSNPTIHHT